MVAQQSYPPTPPGHQRHLLAVPFETDLSFAEIVTAPDPYEEGVDEEERTRRHRLQQQQLADDHRRIGEAAAAIVEPMNGNPLARHGYLFGNPVEAKEMSPVEGLTGAAYLAEFDEPEFDEPEGGWAP